MKFRESFETPAPAIVLAEGEFGKPGGKTSNGVVMHSEVFDTRAVIDSETAGQSPSAVLGRPDAPEIPIVDSVSDALEAAPEAVVLVIGVAPAGGELPTSWVDGIETAIRAGCDVVSGLHTFLADEAHWAELALEHDARLFDVRKPPRGTHSGSATGPLTKSRLALSSPSAPTVRSGSARRRSNSTKPPARRG